MRRNTPGVVLGRLSRLSPLSGRLLTVEKGFTRLLFDGYLTIQQSQSVAEVFSVMQVVVLQGFVRMVLSDSYLMDI